MAVSVGITSAGLLVSFELGMEYTEVGGAAFPPFLVPSLMSNATAARIAMLTGSRGPCLSYSTACASGATAIGEMVDKIRAGQLDAAVAGGVDAPVNFGMVTAFSRMRALSSRVDDPAAASRPFDRDRDGFVMGEGATFVVLERL
nr:beta-ketoacyl synthase N-terminal-like domain-containing protein [Micromonospora sp. DSM 115978]